MLEASDRVGGRVWSERLANGALVERGAEFVLPGYETMRETAARLGLGFREKGTLYGDREPRDGPPVTRDELHAAVTRLRDARGATLADALAALPATEGARAAIASRLAVSTAYELDDQPASILADGAAGFGAFPSHGIDGGNDLLARGLAAALDLRLGERVERVAWSESGVVVGGERADVCVVATPARAIAFDPPLPAWKQRTLDAVSYGHAAKLFLQLEREVEPSATLSVSGRYLDVDRARLARGVVVRRHRVGPRCSSTSRTVRSGGRRRSAGSDPSFPMPTPSPSSSRGRAAPTLRGHSRHRSTTTPWPNRSARSRSPASTRQAIGTA